MTRFLACMFTLLQICLTPSKAILFPPKNLTVGLLDFKAIAEWLPGKENPPDARYTSEFISAQKMSGGKWNNIPHCNDTDRLKCELTFDGQPNELYWNYFVRVKTTFKGMSSNWTTTSKTFQPYGDTRLSPPNVKISSEQKSITINFSHWLELKAEIKPLEYQLYLFESSPVGESKAVALISTSESSYIFHELPSGKNYCASVSASHQKASKNNNFNTTRCVFLLDSTRSFVLVVCVVALMLIIFSTGICLSFGCFYHMKLEIKNLPTPNPLIVKPLYKIILKPTPEESQSITKVTPKKEINAERHFSSSEEDGASCYQPREELTSSTASANAPEQDEEADASNKREKYTLANALEDETFETDDGSMPPGGEYELGSISANTLNTSGSSETLQMDNVNTFLNPKMESSYAEKTVSCSSGSDHEREEPAEEEEEEEEEDNLILPNSNSESGYEPRHGIIL